MTRYGVQVIHEGDERRLADFQQALDAALRRDALHLAVEIDVTERPLPLDLPGFVVVFGSEQARESDRVIEAVVDALGSGRVVVPVAATSNRFGAEVPATLRTFNAHFWEPDGPDGLARLTLEELGIEERQRRVFISHKRDDGLLMAEQLHDELSHRRFKPFIDRFAIPAGADVSSFIADALEDYAFLLLIESPLAASSEYVFYEVDYALSHYMGMAIVSWPNADPVPGAGGLARVRLSESDLTEDRGFHVLVGDALEHVVAAVEEAHARGLVRRRQNVLLSTQEAAQSAGKQVTPLTGWRLLVAAEDTSDIVGVTTRLPETSDLFELDSAAARLLGDDRRTVLVHAARRLDPQREELLGWAAGDRSMTLLPENAVGRYWST
jgi:hypothetical protein